VETPPEPQTVEKVKKIRKPREGITNQLQIILEVIEHVRKNGQTRLKAIQLVAEKRGIARATVNDKCCRLLGINAETFDKMINEPNLEELRNLMISKWEKHKDLINGHIDSMLAAPEKEAVQDQSETADAE